MDLELLVPHKGATTNEAKFYFQAEKDKIGANKWPFIKCKQLKFSTLFHVIVWINLCVILSFDSSRAF